MGEEITEQSLKKQMRKLQVFMEIFGSTHVYLFLQYVCPGHIFPKISCLYNQGT
jgi:hypothetical protein